MLPKDWEKTWIIILGIVIIFVVGSSFFLNKQIERRNSSTDISSTNSTSDRRIPTDFWSQFDSNFKIIYQGPNDTSGRTIMYTSGEKYAADGAGMQEMADGFPIIIGKFERWENMSGSSNKILYLTDPVNHSSIPPIVVNFGVQEGASIRKLPTVVSVENLLLVKDGSKPYFSEISSEKRIDSITQKKLNELIQPGDALFVIPQLQLQTKPYKWNIVYTEDGSIVASLIRLRRWNGEEDISWQ